MGYTAPRMGPRITFDFEGESISAQPTDTVASALWAAGERIFSRSVKYHRPRGPFCFAGACSHCLMRVNGTPNVFTCQTPVQPGMRVERQNAFPTAKLDIFASIDWMFPKGLDHHEMFAGVPVAEKVMAHVARHLAGLGLLPESVPPAPPTAQTLHVQIAIVGGGAAGTAAAQALHAAQTPFLLLEREHALGGRWTRGPFEEGTPATFTLPAESIRLGTTVIGLYQDAGGRFLAAIQADQDQADQDQATPGQAPAIQAPPVHPERSEAKSKGSPARLLKIYAQKFLITMGGNPTSLAFENNDLPGVLSGRAATYLVRQHKQLPGNHIAVVGFGPELTGVAQTLQAAGSKLAAVLDLKAEYQVLKAHGPKRVRGLTFRHKNAPSQRVHCDAVVVALPPSPSFELARQAGADIAFDTALESFVVRADENGKTHAPDVFVAGDITGSGSANDAARSGERAASALLQSSKGSIP